MNRINCIPQCQAAGDISPPPQHAVSKKVTSSEKRDHWLDYADDKYSQKLIADVKAVLSVLFLYIPIPIFWALFDQQVGAAGQYELSILHFSVCSMLSSLRALGFLVA